MNCINNKCTITNDDERMIACWLCNGLCHYKCTGLTTLVAESASKNNNNGLQWCCIACRKINVSFYRFFQGTITKVLEIQNEANKLSDRISNFGKLFDDYKSLDSVKSPVQSSPKRRKSSRKTNKGKQDDQQTEPNGQQASLISDNATTYANSIDLVNSSSTSSQIIANQLSTAPQHNPNYANVVMNNVTKTIDASSNSPNPSGSGVITNHTNTFLMPLPFRNNLSNNSPANAPGSRNPLRAVAPKKTIFVSRLVNDTSADDVEYYIKSKVGQNTDISIYKYQFSQERSISSFKITVTDDIFQHVFDSNFWPENTLIREYVYKERQGTRNVGVLPRREQNLSKN